MKLGQMLQPAIDIVGSVGLAALAAACVAPWLGPEHINQIALGFVASVAFVAGRRGIRLALLATVASALIYDFFFLEPRYSLTIYDPTDVIAFVLFSIVAVIVSNIGARARSQALLASQRLRFAQSMQHFVEALAREATLEGLCAVSVQRLEDSLDVEAGIFLRRGRDWQSLAGISVALVGPKALDTAASRQTDLETDSGWSLYPLPANPGTPMCCAIRGRQAPAAASGRKDLWLPFVEQIKGNILRIRQSQEIERIGRDAEYERFRTLLVTSISHDLRSPLAVVRGAAELLRDPPAPLCDQQRRALADDIVEQVDYLAASLTDVLEMSKLEAGAVQAAVKACDVRAVVERVAIASESLVRGHNLRLHAPQMLPRAMADPTLLERALLNLLDNAAKYAPQGGNIDVSLSATTGSVVIEVSDEGPGLDPSDLPHIFDKFYRSQRAADRPGSGLGLAIVRGLVERMGGSVTAGNRIGARGATFTIRLEAVPERSLAQL